MADQDAPKKDHSGLIIGMLTAANIVVTLALWSALAFAIFRNIRGESPAKQVSQQQPVQTSGKMMPGIPTISGLLGQSPKVTFDAKRFFAEAYYSPVTAELENNIKLVAEQNSPDDREAFYARLIGLGLASYHHDVTWLTIYRSQIYSLRELNLRGIIPIADVKLHYDKAAIDFPKTYENYSFDQWIGYMADRMLIARYPSDMIEISFNGRDFLRYLAHVARDTNVKAN